MRRKYVFEIDITAHSADKLNEHYETAIKQIRAGADAASGSDNRGGKWTFTSKVVNYDEQPPAQRKVAGLPSA